jgi:hypothetical protein
MLFNDHKIRDSTVARAMQAAPTSVSSSLCSLGSKCVGIILVIIAALVFIDPFRSMSDMSPTSVDSNEGTHEISKQFPGEDLSSSQFKKIETMKNEIDVIQNRIFNEWNVSSYPNFLQLMHIPPLSWKLQKLKFLRLLFDSLHEEISDSDIKGRENNVAFVIGFSGSSVTAGHDNYFSEAYPNVVYENLLPFFNSLNISLVVRNHAVGNNPCYAYDACIETHLGDDLDIVGWEQSMNCGRDPRPLDTFTRQTYFMKKKVPY